MQSRYLIDTVIPVAKNNEYHSTYVPYLLCVAKKNELNLLMLYIWLVRLFVSRTITNEFIDAPYLVGTVAHARTITN